MEVEARVFSMCGVMVCVVFIEPPSIAGIIQIFNRISIDISHEFTRHADPSSQIGTAAMLCVTMMCE
jgi:hypothetical protein